MTARLTIRDFSELSPEETAALFDSMSPEEKASKLYDWGFWARPEQLAPEGDWGTWLALCGRGWGKTEAGAQWIRERVKNGAQSIAIIAETQKDLEEVMVPRIVSVHPPSEAPKVRYKPVRLKWPNGAIALGYNGTEPDQLRGPEFDTAWVDELAKYRSAQDLWDMLQFTMRRPDPRVFVTTTPRPIPIIKSILAASRTIAVRRSTFDNADNLPAEFLQGLLDRYEGTRLGRQELEADILGDVEGAIFTRKWIEDNRIKVEHGRLYPEEVHRIVVAIDPAVTSGEKSDDTGIIVAGCDVGQHDSQHRPHGYVLDDVSGRYSPNEWAKKALHQFHRFHADCIIAESNQGGEMVANTIQTWNPNVPVRLVHATKNKATRAEPVAGLYEQNRVHHYGGFAKLEDEMTSFKPDFKRTPGNSPDRMDALVWAFYDLIPATAPAPTPVFGSWGR